MSAINTMRDSHPAFQGSTAESNAYRQARKDALAAFEKIGFPTTKVEEWKYTSTRLLRETEFVVDTGTTTITKPPVLSTLGKYSARIVFVNGTLHPEWSEWPASGPLRISNDIPATGEYTPSKGALFSTLNDAFRQDSIHIHIARKTVLADPIQIVVVGAASSVPICAHPRVFIHAEQQSECTIVQSHYGQGEAITWVNAVVHTQVDAAAIVDHIVVHHGSENLQYVGHIDATVKRDGSYRSHTFWCGGPLCRNDLTISLDEPGSQTDLFGLYLGTGQEHIDNHTVVEHRVPHCQSNELYKGVLAGRAKAVFNGRIVVHKDAQKTYSEQANRNLLLSEKAVINTKPELEIYADDVSCAHGTTVGQMDEEGLFYLRSRGIDRKTAEIMLTRAFCEDVLEEIPEGEVRDYVRSAVEQRLTSLTEGVP